ncbi:unnamed protein product [Rhizophagus irregularis]|nr:unnamed protein product [Rhizophagus irregularis]
MPPFTKISNDIPLPTKEESNPDFRNPLYIGEWKKSIPYVDEDIAIDNLDEPHMKRKLSILKRYPEIEKLYGYDTSTILIVTLSSAAQIFAAYIFATHNLAAATSFQNRLIGLLANIALPFPIAMSFRRYHLEHHTFQGVIGFDPDLPLEWEKKLIRGNSFLKFIWIIIYPIMYVVRGLAMGKEPCFWEYVNWVVTITFDVLIYQFCGMRGLLYLFLSLWVGYSIHPAAAHFIQEHYTFDDGQETYSYYGILNLFFMNIGYHNEHHDFAKVPWSNLPEIRKIAPEFYDNLAYHTSWFMVHWNFIFQKQYGPQSRVGRTVEDHKKGRKLVKTILNESKILKGE